MKIFNEEVFGPVMTVVKIPGNDDEECIRLVNQCEFGLGSSIFTDDDNVGLAVGRRFRTGMLTVNDYASNYLIQSLPFGGVKKSGFGRFAGKKIILFFVLKFRRRIFPYAYYEYAIRVVCVILLLT